MLNSPPICCDDRSPIWLDLLDRLPSIVIIGASTDTTVDRWMAGGGSRSANHLLFLRRMLFANWRRLHMRALFFVLSWRCHIYHNIALDSGGSHRCRLRCRNDNISSSTTNTLFLILLLLRYRWFLFSKKYHHLH